MTDPECLCLDTKSALRLALAGLDLPDCPQHDPPPAAPSAIALNDNAALAATLGGPLTTDPHDQPPTAA